MVTLKWKGCTLVMPMWEGWDSILAFGSEPKAERHQYQLYGLQLVGPFDSHETMKAACEADVRLRLGKAGHS